MSATEQFSSRWGLILATLGMAVGTGNIWRFPRIAASNGGGSFLFAWAVFLLLWSVPLILVEFAMGRETRRGPVGAFARLLGKYVREEQIIPLEAAIHRLTQFPAANLRLKQRGTLAQGYFADIAVFDPQRIAERATFTEPHQLAEGMVHVFVNGTPVLRDGEHTGATPGRVVRGPGWRARRLD